MAESRSSSPIFTPPVNTLPKSDPQIVIVDQVYTEFGARPSAVNSVDMKQNPFRVANLPNGQ